MSFIYGIRFTPPRFGTFFPTSAKSYDDEAAYSNEIFPHFSRRGIIRQFIYTRARGRLSPIRASSLGDSAFMTFILFRVVATYQLTLMGASRREYTVAR